MIDDLSRTLEGSSGRGTIYGVGRTLVTTEAGWILEKVEGFDPGRTLEDSSGTLDTIKRYPG